MKNILMIAVDDLRPEINCFGKHKLHTPNIDRLAKKSTRYTRAYCNYPQCMPSRVSLMSGMRLNGPCYWSRELRLNGETTLPAHLKENGMTTISVGKVYHEPLDDKESWDELHLETCKPKADGGMEHEFHDYQLPENAAMAKKKFTMPYSEVRESWEGLPPLFECADAPEERYVDHKVATKAIECIERHQDTDKGLFLAAGFYRPHLPWIAPKKYWDLYQREDIDLADNPFFPKNGIGKSNLCDFMHYGDQEVYEKFDDIDRYHDDDFPVLSEAKQRECIHAYWACVSFMDAQVGRLLDALEANSMAEDTAIILWGDNGYHLGEHKLWSKVTNYDEATRVPLLLHIPGNTKGEEYSKNVELVDIYPTICSALGTSGPVHLHGKQLPFSPSEKPKKFIYSRSYNGMSVLSNEYRITYYPQDDNNKIEGRGNVELYDHRTDRRENENVAGNPDYTDVFDYMSHELCRFYGLRPDTLQFG